MSMFNSLTGMLGQLGMMPNMPNMPSGNSTGAGQSSFSPSPFSQGMQSTLGGPGSTFMGQNLQGGLQGLINKNIAGERKDWDAANPAQTPTPSGGGGMWGHFNKLKHAIAGGGGGGSPSGGWMSQIAQTLGGLGGGSGSPGGFPSSMAQIGGNGGGGAFGGGFGTGTMGHMLGTLNPNQQNIYNPQAAQNPPDMQNIMGTPGFGGGINRY